MKNSWLGAGARTFGSVVVLGLLSACGGESAASPSPAASRAAEVSAPAKPSLTGSAAAASGAAAASAAAGPPIQVNQANWQQIVDAAKKEGGVVVWGENGQPGREFEKDAFEKAYPDIKVELFQANSSAERDQRYVQEYKAGVAKVDVLISGSAGVNATVKPQGLLQDVRPYLLPEVLDPKTWRDGKIYWVDQEKKFMLHSDTNVYPVVVNKSVDDKDIQNYSDLLNPKWKGKIVMTDGRESGGGFSEALFFYYAIGKDFFDKFYGSGGVVFSADQRKNVEWVDQGRMMINLQARNQEIEPLRKLGSTFKTLPPMKQDGKPLEKFSGSSGILFLPNLNPLPHPNAAVVYANWFYSKAGQQAMVDIIATPSNRADVDMRKVPEYSIPKSGVEYLNMNDQMFTDTTRVKEMRDQLNKIYVPAQA
jgi:iron(III) transport system substrate-binding protein